MTLVDFELPDQGTVGETAQRQVPHLRIVPAEGETSEPVTDITSAQDFLDQTGLQLGDPLSSQVTERHGAGFITQGFVTGIETQIREHYFFVNKARFEAHLPPIDLPLELLEGFQALVEGVKDDPHTQLSIRVGHEAVRPVVIRDNIATPARNPLQQGSSIELLEVIPNVVRPHTDSEHPRPHVHAGSYGAFLSLAGIGRILGDEGTLDLKLVKPRIGTHVTRVSLEAYHQEMRNRGS